MVERQALNGGPFTVEQKVALRKVFLAYLLEREEKRKMARVGGAAAK